MGFIFSIIAGAAMSLQGVINTRLSERIGLYESNVFVQGTAFLASLIALWFLGKGDFAQIGGVNKLYLTGGLLGIVITITVMLGMGKLNPALATIAILITQLFVSSLISGFGILGTEKEVFGWNKYLGLFLMLVGILVFKYKIK